MSDKPTNRPSGHIDDSLTIVNAITAMLNEVPSEHRQGLANGIYQMYGSTAHPRHCSKELLEMERHVVDYCTSQFGLSTPDTRYHCVVANLTALPTTFR